LSRYLATASIFTSMIPLPPPPPSSSSPPYSPKHHFHC
jgi:hypothetical protein